MVDSADGQTIFVYAITDRNVITLENIIKRREKIRNTKTRKKISQATLI